MKPWVRYFLVGLGAFVLGAAAAGGNSSETSATKTVTETQAADAPKASTSTASSPAPKRADISSDLTCDYNLDSSSGDIGGSFIAGGTVRNDGDAPGRATVSARWTLLGSAPARASKTIRVAPGHEREVQLKVIATIGQISAYQSGNTKCHISAH